MAPPKGHPRYGGRQKGTPNRIASLAAKKLAKTELTAEVTVETIRRGALYDVRTLFDAHGNLKPVHQLTEDEAMPIAGIEVQKRKNGEDTDTVVKVRLADRGRYVEMAAKYHALLVDRTEVGITKGLAELLLEIAKARQPLTIETEAIHVARLEPASSSVVGA
jgi:hypothetical protein